MGDENVNETDSDEYDTNDELRGPSSSKRKRSAPRYAMKYDKKLEETYKWICPDSSDRFKAFCKLCTKSFRAETSDIKRHALTAKHLAKIKACDPNAQKTVVDMLKKKVSPIEDRVKLAEMKLAGYFAAHDEPFSRMDHLVEVLKEIFPDSEIAQSLAMKRTKIKGVIMNVIGEAKKEELAEKLRRTKFSILTDESTDVSSLKTACVLVRFYDDDSGRVVSRFWELEQVFNENDPVSAEGGATAARLYESMMNTFKTKDIPIQNITGFGSDGCNVMMGNTNSVKTRMMELCPGIRVVKCICHSLHLCASEACKVLPRTCEDLARNCYNFLKNSAKRQAQFAQFQKFFQLDVLKLLHLLHPSQTRWLSLSAVIDRMLEMWEALKLFFVDKCLTERLRISEDIHRALCDPFVKAYYLFLQWVLPKFTRLNEYFQSEKTVVTVVHERMTTTYTEFLMMYMKRDYVCHTPISEIQPDASSNFLDISQIYLGVATMRQISTSEAMQRPDIIADFRLNCQKFLVTSCLQIQASRKKEKVERKETSTVNGVLLADQAVRKKKGCCKSFTPSKIMMSRMNAVTIYNFPKSEVEESDDDDAEGVFILG